MPFAIDTDGSAGKKFGFSYQGTVLIDRLGKVLYATTSSVPSSEFVEALQKSGVW